MRLASKSPPTYTGYGWHGTQRQTYVTQRLGSAANSFGKVGNAAPILGPEAPRADYDRFIVGANSPAIQPLDSSARNLLICNGALSRTLRTSCQFRKSGARNGHERVECGRERQSRAAGEVRRLPQKPSITRGSWRDQARKNPNRERLGFCYLVEPGGFEPPSASTLLSVLHA